MENKVVGYIPRLLFKIYLNLKDKFDPKPKVTDEEVYAAEILFEAANFSRFTSFTFINTCGYFCIFDASSLRDFLDLAKTCITCRAVNKPSPVFENSRKITWPDCSPPNE